MKQYTAAGQPYVLDSDGYAVTPDEPNNTLVWIVLIVVGGFLALGAMALIAQCLKRPLEVKVEPIVQQVQPIIPTTATPKNAVVVTGPVKDSTVVNGPVTINNTVNNKTIIKTVIKPVEVERVKTVVVETERVIVVPVGPTVPARMGNCDHERLRNQATVAYWNTKFQ